jgi:uncharacterized protein YcfL
MVCLQMEKILAKSLKKMKIRLEITKKMYYYSKRGMTMDIEERYRNKLTIFYLSS